MLDQTALNKISYGLYVLTSAKEGKINGMIVNSVIQVTAEPAKILASVNKASLTHEYIMASKVMAIMPVTEHADMLFIGNFGFRTGRNFDKFAKYKYELGITGAPIVLDNTNAAFEVKVSQTVDVGTHTLFIGEIAEAKNICPDACMTYQYYHEQLKGKVPKGGTHG
ncbi:ferric-chelate reductase [NAD(P)H] [Elusimicrobium simillimum]|uniref:flavin reductase family protein n=1 Tax=Elusimicrobium simillimum TaxID=3143438 RepID=UPI003C6F6C2B